MSNSTKSSSAMKETSLRSLKQKMQKNGMNQGQYDIRTDSYKSPPQRMSGPTVDMINNASPQESNVRQSYCSFVLFNPCLEC